MREKEEIILFITFKIKASINFKMEETVLTAPNNDGKIVKLSIKQKNMNIKKRKVKTWTSEEDEKLIQLYEEYPKRWNFIASMMIDRN